jgi:chorismate-pyruvate lyase
MLPNYRRSIPAALLTIILLPPATAAQSAANWPDTFLARVEATAIVESLNATLLAARSATFTLDKWCADHKLGNETKIRARLIRDVDKPVTAEQRSRLQVGDEEPVKFRHVELACGSRVLSEADNWYVPSRLTTEMNQLLETTDTPFGRAIADLKPYRQTFAVEILWKPLPDGWELRPPAANHPEETLPISHQLFAHRALLFTPERIPISEVAETYTSENLAFTPPR